MFVQFLKHEFFIHLTERQNSHFTLSSSLKLFKKDLVRFESLAISGNRDRGYLYEFYDDNTS